MEPIRTARLRLVPSTTDLASAEWRDRSAFFAMLGVPERDDWPSEDLRDVLPSVAEQLRELPESVGWLTWYWILEESDVLVGGGGFKGLPDENGLVEIGYETCVEHRRRGFATEAVGALIEWAFAHEEVACVCAEARSDNVASRRVLYRLGMIEAGDASEPELIRYERRRAGARAVPKETR